MVRSAFATFILILCPGTAMLMTIRRNTTGNDAGVGFLCDPRRRTTTCKYHADAQALGFPQTKTLYILFCPNFFNNPQALECQAPGSQNPAMMDMGGAVLHELLHVKWLVNRNIGDGWHPDFGWGAVYDWWSATMNAQNAVLPGFDVRNLPVNVVTNYVYYAFAVRAAATDCSWTTWIGNNFGLGSLSG